MVGSTERGCCEKLLYIRKWHPECFWNKIRLAVISAENISIPKKLNLQKLRDGSDWWVDLKIHNLMYLQHFTSERLQKHAVTLRYEYMLSRKQEHDILAWKIPNRDMHLNG